MPRQLRFSSIVLKFDINGFSKKKDNNETIINLTRKRILTRTLLSNLLFLYKKSLQMTPKKIQKTVYKIGSSVLNENMNLC